MRLKYIALLLTVLVLLSGFGMLTVFAEPSDIQPNSSSGADDPTAEPEPPVTEPIQETEPPYVEPTEPPYEETDPPYVPQEPTAEDTQPPVESEVEQQTTEAPKEEYTEKPTLPRDISVEGESGNLFVGLALWIAVIIGVIVVSGILISTHKRKRQ